MTQELEREITASEEAAIRVFMARLAAVHPDLMNLPDSELLFVKAQLQRRWDAEQKVLAGIDFMEPVLITLALAAGSIFVNWVMSFVVNALV